MNDKTPLQEIEELKRKGDFEALVDMLKYREDTEVRSAALLALREIDPERAADVAFEFARDNNRRVSSNALKILAERSDLRCLPFIEHLVKSHEEFDREFAIELLKEIGRPEAVRLLLYLADDPIEDIWSAAFDAIIEMGEIAVPALVEAMGNVMDRLRAAELLAELRDERSVAPLLAMLKSSEGYDRSYFIRALRFSSSPELIEIIGEALNDESAATRTEAAQYLAKQESERAAELLEKALADKDVEVKLTAAEALAGKASSKAVTSLMELLGNDDGKVRSRAIVALARAMGAESLPHVERALAEDDKFVRCAAVRALSYLGTPEAVRRMLLATEDPYELVRKEADELLVKMGRDAVENAVSALPDNEILRRKIEELFG